jgi:hypothetical protein
MNLFEQLILEADAEAAEIEKLKKGSANASKIQEIIDKLPEGKDKQEAQKELDSAIKDLSAREQKTAPKPSAVATPPPADQAKTQGQQAPANQASADQSKAEPKRTIPPPKDNSKPSADVTPPAADQSKTQGQQPAQGQQAPAAQPQAQAEPSDEEKQMLQKLHNSPYDPKSKSDKRNLDILRQARQQVGKDANLKTLSKTVYGIQYAKPTDQNKATPSQAKAPAAAPAAPAQPAQFQAGLDKQNTLNKLAPEPEKPFPNAQNDPNKVYAKGPVAQPTQQVAQQASAPKQPATNSPAIPPTQPNQVTQQTSNNPKSWEGASSPFMREVNKLGTAFKNSVSNIYGGNNPSKNANVAQQPKPKEKSESEEEKIKKCKDCGLNKITVQEKNNISKFLMHLSEKNYSSAHKYLKAIVNSKINKIVSERIDKI